MKNTRHFHSANEPVINQLGLAPQLLFFFLFVLWLFALVLGVKPAKANIYDDSVAIEIRNSSYESNNHYFDVYLRQVGVRKVLLGSSDIVISLNYSADAVAELNYLAGSCQFFSNNGLPINNYGSGISSNVVLRNGVYQLVINIYGPSFDESDFNNELAAIDARVNFHRLGRFVIPHVSNQFNLAGSALYLQGSGLKTAVYAYDQEDNFKLKAVAVSFSFVQNINSNPVWVFEAQKLGSSVKLNWQLAGDVASMELQKSFDGKNWESVNGAIVQNELGFVSEDLNPAGARVFDGANLIWYRLAVKGNDGKLYFSGVEQLSYIKGISMVTFPNPVLNELRIRFNDGELSDFQVQIFGVNGQLVAQSFGSHQQEVQLDLSSLPAGQYILRVSAGAEAGVGRIIVQN